VELDCCAWLQTVRYIKTLCRWVRDYKVMMGHGNNLMNTCIMVSGRGRIKPSETTGRSSY
jgi:hypothetical protein